MKYYYSHIIGICLIIALLGFGTAGDARDMRTTALPTKHLTEYGAVGNGVADDTKALIRAFARTSAVCLEGDNKNYRITGSLRITEDFCLKNAYIVQAAPVFETASYITQTCPKIESASAVIDCGNPGIPETELPALKAMLNLRTLFIRSTDNRRLKVFLYNVKVDRGRRPESGSRTDAAGIWVDGADRVEMTNVEVTGEGKGFGLFINNSRNVALSNIYIHDMIWRPYSGDRPMVEAEVRTKGWNLVPIVEFRDKSGDGPAAAKFYGVRIQEQLTCMLVTRSHDVVIRGTRISKCMAQFDSVALPWQTDGLDIGGSSQNILVTGRTMIDSTWEGMDIVANGDGIQNLRIEGVTVTNSFGFGIKLGKRLAGAKVTNSIVRNAGLAGIVVYGPAKNISISSTTISGVGSLRNDNAFIQPWPNGPRAGIRLMAGKVDNGQTEYRPDGVVISNIAINRGNNGTGNEYGVLNEGAAHVQVRSIRATGFSRAAVTQQP